MERVERWIGIYQPKKGYEGTGTRYYRILAAPNNSFKGEIPERGRLLVLVAKRRLPSKIAHSLAENSDTGSKNPNKLGLISYNISEKTARTQFYHPKDYISQSNRRKVRGLGYFVEAITTNLLQKEGYRYFSTNTSTPAFERANQLAKINLQAGKAMPYPRPEAVDLKKLDALDAMLSRVEFPSLLEQFQTGFAPRRELDSFFLEMAGVEKEEAEKFLKQLYETLTKELLRLKGVMG